MIQFNLVDTPETGCVSIKVLAAVQAEASGGPAGDAA